MVKSELIYFFNYLNEHIQKKFLRTNVRIKKECYLVIYNLSLNLVNITVAIKLLLIFFFTLIIRFLEFV